MLRARVARALRALWPGDDTAARSKRLITEALLFGEGSSPLDAFFLNEPDVVSISMDRVASLLMQRLPHTGEGLRFVLSTAESRRQVKRLFVPDFCFRAVSDG